jgi:hypothetical protein
VKILKLNNTKEVAIVDDEDYALLSRYSWTTNQKGHVKTHIYLGKSHHTLLLHRLIMNPTNEQQVDHINRNKLDNRKENLRICYSMQNSWNRSKYDFPKYSKYKGVSFIKNRNKWTAYITYNGCRYFLGYYNFEDDAARAYNEKAQEFFGEFAVQNYIEKDDNYETVSD